MYTFALSDPPERARGNVTDTVDEHGDALLAIAARNGHLAMIDKLLRRNVNLEARNLKGETPLFVACEAQQYDAVRKLIAARAFVNTRDDGGQTPLSRLAEVKGPNALLIMRLLISCNAAINVEDAFNRKAIRWAASLGSIDAVKLLLEHGADFRRCDAFGDTPLIAAARENHDAIVRLFIEHGADLEAVGEGGKTALCAAANRGHAKTVTELIHAGANPQRKDDQDRTPLSYASSKSHHDVVRVILRRYLDIPIDDPGEFELAFSLLRGHVEFTDDERSRLQASWVIDNEPYSRRKRQRR